MNIRRKLFLAFVAAATLPLVAMSVLARLYLQRARVDVEQRFVQHAHDAARLVRERANDRTDILKSAMKRLGQDMLSPHPETPFPGVKVFPPAWLETPEGAAELAREAAKMSAKTGGAKIRVEARVEQVDEEDVKEAVKRFRAAHPQVLGVKVIVDNETLFEDVAKHEELAFQIEPGEEKQLALVGEDGRRYLVWARDVGATRIVIEFDPLAMLEPMEVAGVRAFYLRTDGRAQHTPEVAARLDQELPLSRLALDIPMAGGSERVEARGESWRLLALASTERDQWDYAGSARLVAVAPQELIDGPINRIRAEVVIAGLVSLLVAMGLSYFLSGRFTESVENLKRGVDALSRGEFAHLEKSSGDELGGELVESMNRMASVLAERTRREEIESWRRLVRVLSHEINNTLGPVKSVATTVRDQLAPKLEGETGDDLRSSFKLIVDRVDSLSSFISGYAVLAKLPPPEREPADLNEIVRGAVSMLRDKREIVEVYDDQVGTPPIDRQQVERVAINLVKNAVEAAASRVWVKTGRRGDTVELTVEDDGPGIAAEARAHLFVPYYTTKPGGSGIGLALARQIVLGHGGTIGTRDREGGGTIVFVVLPLGLM